MKTSRPHGPRKYCIAYFDAHMSKYFVVSRHSKHATAVKRLKFLNREELFRHYTQRLNRDYKIYLLKDLPTYNIDNA